MKRKWLFAFPIVLALIGIVVGSFMDFEIASNIFSKDNAFGIAFAGFGEAPVYFFISSIGTILILLSFRRFKSWKNDWYKKIACLVVGIIGILVGLYTQMSHITSVNALNKEDQMWVIGLPISIVINGLGVLFGVWIYPKDDDSHILRYLVTMILTIGIAILCTEIIKKTMRRPRFRMLNEVYGPDALYNFCNWWQSGRPLMEELGDKVISEEFKSFPSGHATMTSFVMPALAYLPLLNNKIKAKQELLFGIGLVYTLVMCLSRMIVGAHFLSDVSFGLLITSVSFLVFDLILSHYNKKHPIESKEIVEY